MPNTNKKWVCDSCKAHGRNSRSVKGHEDCEILKLASDGTPEVDQQGQPISCACTACSPTEEERQEREERAEQRREKARQKRKRRSQFALPTDASSL